MFRNTYVIGLFACCRQIFDEKTMGELTSAEEVENLKKKKSEQLKGIKTMCPKIPKKKLDEIIKESFDEDTEDLPLDIKIMPIDKKVNSIEE